MITKRVEHLKKKAIINNISQIFYSHCAVGTNSIQKLELELAQNDFELILIIDGNCYFIEFPNHH